jgi:putative ABC transport system substrate-binding protein
MERRRVLTAALAGALAAPLAGEAQPAGDVRRIGVLAFTSFPGEERERIEAFGRGLRDLGYVEGRNIALEYRSSDGQDERLPALAAELVRSKVDVIATYGTRSTRAARQATSRIPIVMLTVLDPIAAASWPRSRVPAAISRACPSSPPS